MTIFTAIRVPDMIQYGIINQCTSIVFTSGPQSRAEDMTGLDAGRICDIFKRQIDAIGMTRFHDGTRVYSILVQMNKAEHVVAQVSLTILIGNPRGHSAGEEFYATLKAEDP